MSTISLLPIYIFCIFTIFDCESVDIGNYIKTCSRKSDDSDECMVNAVRSALPLLSDGIPDLGIEPIDPFHQKEFRFTYDNYQVNVTMIMRNIIVEGIGKAEVRKARLRADEEHFHLEIDMFSPRIVITGFYHGSGTNNALKVNTTGTFNCTMIDSKYTWKLDGKPEVKNNITYMKIYDFYMRPDVANMLAHGTTDDPELKTLFELGNNFLKENWKIVYREMLPYAQASWKKSGTRIANKIFMKTPYDQLFPVTA